MPTKRRRWVLTFSRDIILVFPKNMLCKAGDEGHRCSVWDLLSTAGDPPASLCPPYPASSSHPSHLVMLQGIQTSPQTLDLGSNILIRKDEVPGHSRPPFCKDKRGPGSGLSASSFCHAAHAILGDKAPPSSPKS